MQDNLDYKEFCERVQYVFSTVNDNEFNAATTMITAPDIEDGSDVMTTIDVGVYIGMMGNHPVGLIRHGPGRDCSKMLNEGIKNFPNVEYLVAVGICYGFNREDTKLADVLISKQIIDLDSYRISKKNIEIRGDHINMKDEINSIFCVNAANVKGLEVAHGRLAKHLVGKIASSSDLVDNAELKEIIYNQVKLAYGGEMEGGELLRLQKDGIDMPDGSKKYIQVIVIKAVTDYGDGTKNKEWQFIGAQAAFHYVKGKMDLQADSIVAPVPTEVSPPEEEESVASNGFNHEKAARFPAMDRGIHNPQLKFQSREQIAKLKPKQELIIPKLASGYYPMQSKKHGVCLIINNKTFQDHRHEEREGTDRDEYNLIETWRYLGYHIEVRREAKQKEIVDIFNDIDELLKNINRKMKLQVTNDSFVCCILSHGDNFCIYSSDSKEVKIGYLERALGNSEILRDKPKIFFIQACQGKEPGTTPVTSKLHPDMSGLRADGEKQTSRRSDIYISYATAQGDICYRHTKKGSWFIGVVCRTLCEESKQSSLNELQKFINKGVADGVDHVFANEEGEYRQQPSCSDQLRCNVHFFYESTS